MPMRSGRASVPKFGATDKVLSVAGVNIRQAAFDYYPRLRRVKTFVTSHLAERISLANAARVAEYERTYFSAVFHKRVGISFTSWLKIVRVTKAAELLRAQDYPI